MILADLRRCRASVTAVRCGTFVTMAGPSFRRRRAARSSRQVGQSCIATDRSTRWGEHLIVGSARNPSSGRRSRTVDRVWADGIFGHLADAGRADVGFMELPGPPSSPPSVVDLPLHPGPGRASPARYTAGRRSPSLSSRHGVPVGSQPAVRRSNHEEHCGSLVSNRERRFDVDAGAGDAALVSADGRVREIVELLVGVGDAASSVRRISRPSSEPRSLCQ